MRAMAIGMALAMLPLAACATTGDGGPAALPAASGECKNDGLEAFTGKIATAELGAEMLKVSGAKTLRWGGPGTAMTMDFRPDRLTVSYDEKMAITSARCG
ncbi:I78 family peptidase inhibitor [Sphingobium phenoxybenzoativorans]|uniref:I78 family peptidase inhibitor n=1 Tax=Sphingobium phenoxybenzoativorans TaxID=1592790 RepID=UPI000872B4EC|nr:I78 family peptidase inhibitor [Sphingobium phenoxybenzoativorans]